jgi:hypothetical protein
VSGVIEATTIKRGSNIGFLGALDRAAHQREVGD